MKSVLQALYLMTTAVGNLITMAIIEIFSAFDLPQVFRTKHCNVILQFTYISVCRVLHVCRFDDCFLLHLDVGGLHIRVQILH